MSTDVLDTVDLDELDALAARHTVYGDFAALVRGARGWVPSFPTSLTHGRVRAELQQLADAYDAAQIELGDPRRARRDGVDRGGR